MTAWERLPKPGSVMHGPRDQSESPLSSDFLAGRLRGGFDREDLMPLERCLTDPRVLADGQLLVRRGEAVTKASLLVDGFAFATVRRNDRRFIVGVYVLGDFVDLHGFLLGRLDHDVVAAGPARFAQIDHASLREVTQARPALAEALWFATLLDAAIHRRWIRNLEALDAAQRIAHLYAELHHRMALIGRRAARALRTPFTQADLADMCGISAIHANRAVARLRELGLGQIRRGDLYIGDWSALESYAEFDPDYLYGSVEPSL